MRYQSSSLGNDIAAAVIFGAAAVVILAADAVRDGVQDIANWFAGQHDPPEVAWDSPEGLALRGVRVAPEHGHPSTQ